MKNIFKIHNMKNLITSNFIAISLFLGCSSLTSMAQGGMPTNDSRCNPINVASSGMFNVNAPENLGTTNPDITTYYGNSRPATSEVGELFGSSRGSSGIQHTLWYTMDMPTCGANSVRFSTTNSVTAFNTRLTAFKRAVITDCGGAYKEIASNDDDRLGSGGSSTLVLRPGSGAVKSNTFAPGDHVYVQLSGNTGAAGKFGLVVDVDAPAISAGTVTGTSIQINIPTSDISYGAVLGINLRYRKTGDPLTSYSEIHLSGSATTATIYGLVSGTHYDVWAVYRCEAGDQWVSPKEEIATAIPSSSRIAGPTVTPVGSDCNNVNVAWSTISAVGSYTLSFKLAGSSVVNSISFPSSVTSYSTGAILLPAATYQFWIDINFTDGTVTSTPITDFTTCGAMSKLAENTATENSNSNDSQEQMTVAASNPTAAASVNIFPNPSTVEATIKYVLPVSSEVMTITMFNAGGEVMLSEVINQPAMEGTYKMDLHDYKSGMYFVKVVSEGYESLSKLVVGK